MSTVPLDEGKVASLALSCALLLVAPGAASAQESRYSLAHGCYTVTGDGGQPLENAEQVRLQATALGRYLLYRPDGTFLGGDLEPAPEPSPADWRVEESGAGASRSPRRDTRGEADGALHRRRGLRRLPGGRPERHGRARAVAHRVQRVGGIVEGHMHWMTFEYFGGNFHCGRPWHPYGIPYALPDCEDVEGPQGTAAPLQNFLNYGNPRAAARHQRLPEAHRVVEGQPHLRGHVLALDRARVARRACG